MSELPPTGPRTDVDAPASEPGSAVGAPARREFDTKDTQEIPVTMSMRARSAGFASTTELGDGGAAMTGSATADAGVAGEAPATAEGLRSTVLSRVRETREELLRLIDRFVEQQDRRERAEQEERERAEQERHEREAREEAERRERETLVARAAVEVQELHASDRERIVELEGALALHSAMPAQVAALQTDAVSASIEIARLRQRADELEATAQLAGRVPAVETQLQATERRLVRAGAVLAALRRAVWRLDEASSQTEVLARLLEEATGFASRSALFLVRRPQPLGELRLAAWGACGFSEQGAERIEVLSPAEWQGALDGRTLRGGAELGAPVALASDSAAPLDAMIVPFILRDETRALLYVDRFDADHPFDADALQLLCFVATNALEVLPLRHKRPAGTLAEPEWAGDLGTAPPVSPAPAVAQERPSAVLEATTSRTPLRLAPVPAPAVEPPVVEDRSLDTVDIFAEPAPRATAPELVVETAPAPPPPSPSPFAPLPELPREPLVTSDSVELIGLETVDLGDSVAPLEPTVEATTQEVDVRALGFGRAEPKDKVEKREEESATGELEVAIPEGLPVPPPSPEPQPASPEPPASFLPSLFGRSDEPVITPGRVALDSLLRPAPTTPPPPPVELWQPPGAPVPRPAPPEAVSSPPPPAPVTPAMPVTPTPPPSPAPSAGREVTPPSDIEGPGWAFSGGGKRGTSDDEHAHEEAKRLARLLVSELQLYNEEEIDEGRRQGNVYRFLKEHIDKSRMLYEERVDERIRSSTDYFREELVKSLAGGDPSRLGF